MLTPKQRRFVEEYLVDLNATQASIRAGYSAKTAEQQGPRLLGNVGVAWLLGHAIADEPSAAAEDGREPYRSGFFGGGFQCWCALIRLNPAFVLEQIDRANASTAKCDRQSLGRRPHQGSRWPSLAAQRKAGA